MRGTTPVVSARELRVRVGRREVLNGLDLDVSVGVHGLLGRNGAGKTTVLRTVATLLRPSSGSLTVFGDAVPRGGSALREQRARIGYSPQLPAVLPQLTVHEQVTYAGWLKGMSTTDASLAALDALAVVRLADRRDERVRGLSGGMVKRLSIAMAITARPELILLDEPTAGLDPEQRVVFRQVVAELGRSAAVVLSTHLIEDVLAVCGQVTVIRSGSRVFHGTPAAMATAGGAEASAGSSDHEASFMALTQDEGAAGD